MQPGAQLEVVPLLVLVFAIGLLPFAAMMVTSYTKIVVVLGLVRNALGVQQVPPNMVLNGIAMIMSVYIVAPMFMDSFDALQRQQNEPAGGGGARWRRCWSLRANQCAVF